MTDMSWVAPETSEATALDAPKGELRKGLWLAGIFFLGLLGWAALTPLDAGAMAQGIVAVSGSRQVVQHQTGGIVTALNVIEGQLVNKGDVLIQISEGQLIAVERGMTGEYITLLAQRARLQAEMSGLRQMPTPPEFATLSKDDRALAATAMQGQRVLMTARRSAQVGQTNVLGQRVLQHRAQIGALNHQMRSNREQQRLLGEELGGLREMSTRGYVPVNRVRAMERSAAELDGNLGALGADVARSNDAIGETNMQMVSLSRQMLESVATEMRDVQLRLDEIQPKLIATRVQIGQSMIRATATGRVVSLKVHTIGGVVGPGQTLMEIVPQDKALVISAKASPSDADDLLIGMDTQVRFSALQDRNLPILHGKISKVSADSLEEDRTGMRYFEVEIIVPQSELEKVRKVRGDIGIRAGLPAEVMVPLRKRTALGYLLEPLTQMFWMAGREH
jgi:HlyD family type I secretion membrane fusion protein